MRRTPPFVALLAVLLAAASPAAAAAPARTLRLASAGTALAAGFPFPDAISANGTAVFETTDQLLPLVDENPVGNDVYARDPNGTLRLVSSGTATAGDSFYLGMSADGERIWYATTKADVPGDIDGHLDIYERRRTGNTIREISVGNAPIDVVSWVDGSDDGSHVLFFTGENVPGAGDTDGQTDLFDRRADGSVRLITPHTALGVNIPFGSTANQHVISADGTHATFFTQESLATSDSGTSGDTYSVPLAGGPYRLISASAPAESVNGVTNRAGTRTWFETKSRLVAADKDTATDVYERRPDGSIRLISGGGLNAPATLIGGLEDGSSVLFKTTEKLLPADADSTGVDFYERRADGSLHLVTGGGSSTIQPRYLGENADGGVVFDTTEGLAGGDTDGVNDIYLRRHDGSLLLLTPGITSAVVPTLPNTTPALPHIPSDQGRTVLDIADNIPGTGDTNSLIDAYEVTANGLRLLAKSGGTGSGSTPAQTVDGSRILLSTFDALVPGDLGGNLDIYESDFAVPHLSGVPTVAGTGKFGGTLGCTAPAFVGEGVTMLISWLRESTVISTSTLTTYRTTLADAGHQLHCRATARNGVGAAVASSPGAIRIAPGQRASALAGFPILGTRLTCTDFAGATRTTYAWKRGTRTVAGRRSRTYKITKADLGKRVTCAAAGSNAAGTTKAPPMSRIVPRLCSVPNVRGLLPAAAKTKLSKAGCRSVVRRVKGRGVAKGHVLGTTPSRKSKRANGARITIRVRR